MSRTKTGYARETVSVRVSRSSLKILDAFAEKYQQGRGDLIREAIQMWINQQVELRGNPVSEDNTNADAVL